MSSPAARSLAVPLTLTALAWVAAVIIASRSGALNALPPLARAALIVAGMLTPAAVYLRSSRLQTLVARVGLRSLTAFHIWRIAAALLFFWYGSRHLLPPLFVQRAGWGDLYAGLLALAVVTLFPRRSAYLVTHLFGLADLVVALATGMLLTRAHAPHAEAIFQLPIALIPFFGVGITGATHLIAFHLLLRRQPHPQPSFAPASISHVTPS